MTFRKMFGIFVVFILTMVVAACNLTSPEATLDPTALTETITVQDPETGQLTLSYPAMWFVDVTGNQINFGDSDATVGEFLGDPPISSGQFQINVLPTPNIGLPLLTETLSPESPPLDFIRFYMGLLTESDPEGVALGEPQAYTINNREGALVTGAAVVDGTNIDIALVGIKLEGGFILFIVSAASGEIDNYTGIVQEIAGSAEYDPTILPTVTEESTA